MLIFITINNRTVIRVERKMRAVEKRQVEHSTPPPTARPPDKWPARPRELKIASADTRPRALD